MELLAVCTDQRIFYASKLLSEHFAVTVSDKNFRLSDTEKKYDILLAGMPCTKDGITLHAPEIISAPQLLEIIKCIKPGGIFLAGMIDEKTALLFKNYGITVYDYASEELTVKNAKLTAEAAVAIAIENSKKALSDCKIIITGYGRIAKALADYLAGFAAFPIIAARSKTARTEAQRRWYDTIDIPDLEKAVKDSDIILNTVPAPIFTPDAVTNAKGAVYIELASKSGIYDTANISEINLIKAPGLPGKYMPQSAGKAVAAETLKILKGVN